MGRGLGCQAKVQELCQSIGQKVDINSVTIRGVRVEYVLMTVHVRPRSLGTPNTLRQLSYMGFVNSGFSREKEHVLLQCQS